MVGRRLFCFAFLAVLVCCAIAAAEQKIIYQKQSPYSTVIVAEDDQGMRTLSFGSVGVRQRIDAVEIDPVVVEVARQFFGFSEDETLKAYVQDGRQFIEERSNVYDIIFLDAFGSESIPYHLATREFLKAVRRAITAQGVVLADVWGPGSNRLYHSTVRTFQEVFDELYILDVQGSANKILIALPRKLRVAREELARRAGAISKQKQFRFDMADLVTYGYQYADEKDPGAQVLIDKK